MPKFSTYDATARVAGPISTQSASPADFGANVGMQDVGAAAQELASSVAAKNERIIAARQRIEARTQTIQRVRMENEFKGKLQELYGSYVSAEDMSNPDTAKAFAAEVNELYQEYVSNFNGLDDIKAKLIVNLDDIRSSYTREMSADVLKAGVELVEQHISQRRTFIANEVSASGDIQDGFNKIRALIEDSRDAISEAKENYELRVGYASVVSAAFNAAINNEDIDGARAALETEGITDFMSTEQLLSMRAKVAALEHSKNKAYEDAKYKMDKAMEVFRLAKGYGMSNVDAAAFAGLPDMRDPYTTLQESLDATRRVAEENGIPWTEQMTLKHLNLFSAENRSTEPLSPERARTKTAQLAPKILSDNATEQDVIDFIAATNAITQPQVIRDEDGMLVTIRPTLTQTTKDALAKLGVNPDGSPINTPFEDAEGVNPSPAPEKSFVNEDDDVLPPEQTAWGLAYKGTGVASTIRAGLAWMPVIGDIFPAGQEIQARTQLTLASRELVDILRRTDRSQTELQELEKDFSIAPEFFTNVNAYHQALIGLDKKLETYIKHYQKELDNNRVAAKDRALYRRFISKASLFRDNLGLPPVFKSYEEMKKAGLPVGAQYRSPDGRLFVVTEKDR